MFSTPVPSSVTVVAPCFLRYSIVCFIRCSGADAPAVIPILLIPFSHSCFSSVMSFIKCAFTLLSFATSTSLFEFELFFEPITSISSACFDISLTAFCLFWVA